jgi:hypothetical protein
MTNNRGAIRAALRYIDICATIPNGRREWLHGFPRARTYEQ